MDSSYFENNFKRTVSCPATRANIDEPRTWLTGVITALSCALLNNGEVIMRTCYVTNVTEQRCCQQMETSVTQASNGFSQSE